MNGVLYGKVTHFPGLSRKNPENLVRQVFAGRRLTLGNGGLDAQLNTAFQALGRGFGDFVVDDHLS